MRSSLFVPRAPPVCSYVIENLTWEFGFWFVSIALGIATVMVFLFVPEVICFTAWWLLDY